MARHQLTPKEQLEGVKKALASPKTPKQFRASLEKRREKLERQVRG